jgi:predicted RNA binding protein YcfA (HicA-like mRNA interferase family)
LTPHVTPWYTLDVEVKNMSSWDKLLARILKLANDLRLSELQKVLESYGYQMKSPRGGSSHVTFRKSGCAPITKPLHEPIKKVYVKMVKDVVESEVSRDEDH